MTDYLRETEKLGRLYCPICEPTADPTSEILDVKWCGEHIEAGTGVSQNGAYSPPLGGEPDNAVGRYLCNGFHRKDWARQVGSFLPWTNNDHLRDVGLITTGEVYVSNFHSGMSDIYANYD